MNLWWLISYVAHTRYRQYLYNKRHTFLNIWPSNSLKQTFYEVIDIYIKTLNVNETSKLTMGFNLEGHDKWL